MLGGWGKEMNKDLLSHTNESFNFLSLAFLEAPFLCSHFFPNSK